MAVDRSAERPDDAADELRDAVCQWRRIADREAERFSVRGLGDALALGTESNEVEVRIFAKPTTRPYRRMGVALASGKTVEEARELARQAAARIQIAYEE